MGTITGQQAPSCISHPPEMKKMDAHCLHWTQDGESQRAPEGEGGGSRGWVGPPVWRATARPPAQEGS